MIQPFEKNYEFFYFVKIMIRLTTTAVFNIKKPTVAMVKKA